MISLKPRSVLLISAIFRVGLILFGGWQDTHTEVRYTDVDYLVFSDAASLMASGHSPYKRTTYQLFTFTCFFLFIYLFIYLFINPQFFLSRSWGKFLFSASD